MKNSILIAISVIVVMILGLTVGFNWGKSFADIKNMKFFGTTTLVYNYNNQLELNQSLRSAWQEHIIWTKIATIRMMDNLPGSDQYTNMLLATGSNEKNILSAYYGNEFAEKFENIKSNYLKIVLDYINANKSKDAKKIKLADEKLYQTADELALLLSQNNPSQWSNEAVTGMLYDQINLTKSVINNYQQKKFSSDVAEFEQLNQESLLFADVLTNGIIKQFPLKFAKN